MSVDRGVVSLYAALLSVDAALYGDACKGAIHNLVIDLSNVGCSDEQIAYELSHIRGVPAWDQKLTGDQSRGQPTICLEIERFRDRTKRRSSPYVCQGPGLLLVRPHAALPGTSDSFARPKLLSVS